MRFRRPTPGKSGVGGVTGDALDDPEQDEEDGQLHEERQTPPKGDAVLLVERHQLLVHLLAIVLVPRLIALSSGCRRCICSIERVLLSVKGVTTIITASVSRTIATP